jgi:ABC-type nitrate/sulfonate/bicarbonate transport system substrate-binding protein
MFKEKVLYLALAVLIVVGTVGAYSIFSQNKKKKNAQKITVSSDFPELKDMELLVDTAKEQGYFLDNGLEVEKKVSNNNAVFLAAGESDLGIFPVPSVIAGFYNDQGFKWVAKTNNYMSSNYAVSRFSQEEINKVKTVGVMKLGNAEQAVWPSILKGMGHTGTDKLKFVAAPDSQTKLALLEKNEIDLSFILSFAQMKELKSKNKYTIIAPRDVFKEDIQMPVGIITMNKVLQDKPELTKGFTKAIYKSVQYIKNNKNKTIATIKSNYGFSDEDAKELYADIMDSRNNLNFVPETSAVEEIANFVKSKAKPKNPNRKLDELIFKDYAQEAIKK